MNRIASFFTILTLSGLLVLTVGCGGKSSSPKPMPEENRVEKNIAEKTGLDQKKDSSSQQETKKKKKKKKKVEKEEATEENAQDFLPPELQVQEKTLPSSASQWSEEDFTYVRVAEPTLFDMALTELSSRLANPNAAEEASRILARFVQSVVPNAIAQEQKLVAEAERLKELEEGDDSDRNRRTDPAKPIEIKFYQLAQKQVAQGMGALASSTSETAQKTVAAFLAGAIFTDDNKGALDAVMNAYATKSEEGKISPNEENLLLDFLLLPEKAVEEAAEFAEVEAPPLKEIAADENGAQQRTQDSPYSNLRGNHPPIQLANGKRIQFRFQGGSGNMTSFTHLDVQKLTLTKYCPASSAIFRAQIARKLLGDEVLQAADTQTKQAFLLEEVLGKFLMKKDFANCIAQILIYRQPEIDEAWMAVLEDNLAQSHILLMKNRFSLFDEKTTDEFRAATVEKRNQLEQDARAREAAEAAEKEAPSGQTSVSLLSRRATLEKGKPTATGNNRNRTVQYSPMVELLMNPNSREALEKEIWTPEMRQILLDKIHESLAGYVSESMANMPEPGSKVKPKVPKIQKSDLQAIQMYLSIPCTETRYQIYSILDKAWLLGPEAFKTSLFDQIETEPGFLMVVKSLDRRVMKEKKDARRPMPTNKKKPNAKAKAPSPGVLLREKRKEIGAAWMEQSYRSVCEWCLKFSEAAKAREEIAKTRRILDRNAPKAEEPKLPEELRKQFDFPKDAKVVSFFTADDPAMPPMAESGRLRITFFEVECSGMFQKMVSTLKSKHPKTLLERGFLSKTPIQKGVANAYWLEHFDRNDETGRRESIDVLIAPARQPSNDQNSRQNDQPQTAMNRRGAEQFRVFVLMMEMDDITGDHQSNFKVDDDENKNDDSDDDSDDSDEEFSDDDSEE